MIFRPSIKAKKKKRKFLAGALIALILVVVIFPEFSFRIVNRPLFYAAKPFLKTKAGVLNWWNRTLTMWDDKKMLSGENKALREKIMGLETKIVLLEILEKENAMLKAALSQEEKREFILASIISRPPVNPYDMLIIDAGSSNGVKQGMPVTAFGNVLLGYATDVFEDISKVKLISSFNEETNIILGSSGISAIAVGTGGENFKITLPRQLKIEAGEKVLTLGTQPYLIGFVEKIESQVTDPYQKIIFRFPMNIQYLNQVFLLKK